MAAKATTASIEMRVALIMAVLLLAGCSSDSDPGPGGVTKGEARQLDDAAAALDKRPAVPMVDASATGDLYDVTGNAPAPKK